MILALDVGNTHIVMGCIEGMEIKNIARISTDVTKTENEYAVLMRQVLEIDNIDYNTLDGAIISSVVPQVTNTLASSIKRFTGISPLVVGAGIKTGLDIKIDNPAQLGSDLVVGMVAALDVMKPPIIAIDMGTATTISVIDGKRHFLGGAIIPGVHVSMMALANRTSQLPKIELEAPKKCISSNTIDCMKSGSIFGTAAMLDGMIDRIEEELGEKANVIATGGIASKVVPYCKREIMCDDNLLLRGLAIIFEKNRK